MRSWPNRAWVGTPKMLMARAPGPPRLLLHERAVALVHRPERLLGRNRGAHLVVVPRALGLRRLLHLEQVDRMDLAAVGAHHTLAEDRIVGRQLLHLGDDLGAVVALERLGR